MGERRYDESETAAIFRVAAEGTERPARSVARGAGLSLADLQAIGREAGLDADAVAHAAIALDVRAAAEHRTLLGLPIGVARSVTLDRRLSDEEWEHLVVELREVFRARGTTRVDGRLRQWTNGNLQVLLEPTAAGDRVRFATMHGAARNSIGAGLAMLGVSGAALLATAATGTLADVGSGVLLVATVGVVMIASGALRLRGWARRRAEQMEHVAARVALAGRSSMPDDETP